MIPTVHQVKLSVISNPSALESRIFALSADGIRPSAVAEQDPRKVDQGGHCGTYCPSCYLLDGWLRASSTVGRGSSDLVDRAVLREVQGIKGVRGRAVFHPLHERNHPGG